MNLQVSNNVKTSFIDQNVTRHYKGFVDCFTKIYGKEGVYGFYKGLTA